MLSRLFFIFFFTFDFRNSQVQAITRIYQSALKRLGNKWRL